jgi:hypothetical protein
MPGNGLPILKSQLPSLEDRHPLCVVGNSKVTSLTTLHVGVNHSVISGLPVIRPEINQPDASAGGVERIYLFAKRAAASWTAVRYGPDSNRKGPKSE